MFFGRNTQLDENKHVYKSILVSWWPGRLVQIVIHPENSPTGNPEGPISSHRFILWGLINPKIKVAEGPLPKAATATKAVNLPAWKKIQIDMPHILSGHAAGGSRVSPVKDIFPSYMNPRSIERAVRDAYRHGKVIRSQGDKVLMQGVTRDGLRIEMWVNKVGGNNRDSLSKTMRYQKHMATIELEPSSFERSRAGAITGRLCLNLAGELFPEKTWSDFPVVVLGWWVHAMLDLIVCRQAASDCLFMDGPFVFTLTKVGENEIDIQMGRRDETPNKTSRVALHTFANSLCDAAAEALAICNKHRWTSGDIDLLRSALKKLQSKLQPN